MTLAKRYPRERFSRSLASICRRLDAAWRVEFDYVSPRGSLAPVYGRLRSTARVLWAFGSWARGASHCQDLDLAIDIRSEWTEGHGWLAPDHPINALPSFDPTRKALFSSPPLVHVLDAAHIRTYGPSGKFAVHPDTLVPIWIAPNVSDDERLALGVRCSAADPWEQRLSAVALDPNYQRAPRLLDAFPLRIEQTGMDLLHAEAAARAHAQGLLAWFFLPHGQHRDEVAELTPDERRISLTHQCSDAAQVSRVISATRDLRSTSSKLLYWYGNGLSVWPAMFEGSTAEAVVITPKWSAQGPNGSLVVTRGPSYSEAAIEAFRKAQTNAERGLASGS